MSLKLFETPVPLQRSENPASVMTRAKRALKHLGMTLRKAKEGQEGPYLIVKGEMIYGAGSVADIANWAKEQAAKTPKVSAAPAAPAAPAPAAPAPELPKAEPAAEPEVAPEPTADLSEHVEPTANEADQPSAAEVPTVGTAAFE